MRFPLLLLVGAFLLPSAHARVLDLHTEIRIAKSGELTVVERVTLEATRDTTPLERELPREARVVDLVRDGHAQAFVLDGTRLRAGGPPPREGRHLYQLTYRAARRVAFLGDHDALHWPLKGGERMTAEVILPASVPARQLRLEASGADYQSLVRDGRAAFRSEAPIALVVRFPKGVVAEPKLTERAAWFFSDYFGLVTVAGLLALSALVLHLIRGQGRNS